jgi:hypothetical protein
MTPGEIPAPYFSVLIATIAAMAATYCMMLDRVSGEGQQAVWAWVHSLNSLVFYANAWALTIYWNTPTSSKLLFRVCNAPAFAIALNFLVTDWLLLV